MLNELNFKMLISCCRGEGGLYQLTYNRGDYQIKKLFVGDYRGMARYKDGFVVATRRHIFMLDEDFNITKKHEQLLEYHGVFVEKDHAYIVETTENCIGIYELPTLKRTGEIRLSPDRFDSNHVNDLYKVGNKLFISMFSRNGNWREQPPNSGVILEYNLKKEKVSKTIYEQLTHPHSVFFTNGDIYYCDSGNYQVKRGRAKVFQAPGWTRGLEIKDDILFIGQSRSRKHQGNEEELVKGGIHMVRLSDRTRAFIPVPSPEVYGVLVYQMTMD